MDLYSEINSLENVETSGTSAAKQLLEAKKIQKNNSDNIRSLFVPFNSKPKSEANDTNLYSQIETSKIDPPTYWKSGKNKKKSKKVTSGENYRYKSTAKLIKNKNRANLLSELKKKY